mgnify:CR=1
MADQKKKKYYFTNHAIDRFSERFKEKFKDRSIMVSQLAREFYDSKPNKSFLNNTRFLVHLGEQYGYNGDFEFRVGHGKVFVCRDSTLVTVYPQDTSRFGENSSRFKVKK